MSENKLDGLKIIRRRFARMKNTKNAVSKMNKFKDKNVQAFISAYDGSPKDLLTQIKKIKKGTPSNEALVNELLGSSKVAKKSKDSKAELELNDDILVEMTMPVNIECKKPTDPNKESIAVMNKDGLAGCGVIDKKYLK